jgi:nuclease S1
MRKLLLITTALVLLCAQSWAWGREGHRIIAAVAEDHLDETTKVMIQSLIGNNHLYSIAPWADDIRKERPETKGWHYVNIPLGSKYDAARDCALPQSCVVAKINDFVKVLTDKKASPDQRSEALKFIVHFVGDVHQPMHTVKEAAGGNGVHVQFLTSTRCGPYDCNLHAVWDTSMILQTGLNQQDYVQRLEQLATTEKMSANGSPEQWANEALPLAQAAWVKDGTNLDDKYYQQEIKVVDRQMAMAGLRLAKLLNDTIGKMTPRDFTPAQTASSAQTSVSPEAHTQTASDSSTGAAPLLGESTSATQLSNQQLATRTSPSPLTLADAAQGNPSVKVWVNTSSGVYHCPGTRWYGTTKSGQYMTQQQAQEKGYRPAYGKVCQ